jgi:hypothetical protein
METLRTESAKVQAFAGHLAPSSLGPAIDDAQRLAGMAGPPPDEPGAA